MGEHLWGKPVKIRKVPPLPASPAQSGVAFQIYLIQAGYLPSKNVSAESSSKGMHDHSIAYDQVLGVGIHEFTS